MANVSDKNEPASDAAKTGEEKEASGKTYRKKKELPSVQYLLAHGDPETAHLPKTWCEVVGFPVALALIFAISMLVFLHAPHHLAPPRKKYSIPGVQRLPIFERGMPLHRHPEAKAASSEQKPDQEKKSEL